MAFDNFISRQARAERSDTVSQLLLADSGTAASPPDGSPIANPAEKKPYGFPPGPERTSPMPIPDMSIGPPEPPPPMTKIIPLPEDPIPHKSPAVPSNQCGPSDLIS